MIKPASVALEKDPGQLRDLKALGEKLTFAEQRIENAPSPAGQRFVISLSFCQFDVCPVNRCFRFIREHLMAACLYKYKWLKLPRIALHAGKGLLGYWSTLAARAAFRKGIASYCGHRNPVEAGTWAGGIVGLKSILGVKKREQALDILQQLSDLGYLSFELEAKSKLLTYCITDYELDCCGAPCDSGTVYTTPDYGFLCVPRSITERLVAQNYIFNEADAWLDLWCHTVSMDPHNAFSFFCSGLPVR